VRFLYGDTVRNDYKIFLVYTIFTEIQREIGRKLIKKMIHPDPEKRISSSDVAAQELRQIKSDLGLTCPRCEDLNVSSIMNFIMISNYGLWE